MNTIEMLKELVENGGEFEAWEGAGNYVSKWPIGAIICVQKDTGEKCIAELNHLFMTNKWKPYVKPVDWSKVPIDTKVICTNGTGKFRRYFNKVIDGKPTVFEKGRDSFTTTGDYEWHSRMELYTDATE